MQECRNCKNKDFLDPWRMNGRDLLFNELISTITKHGDLTDYDKISVLRLLVHKVEEGGSS